MWKERVREKVDLSLSQHHNLVTLREPWLKELQTQMVHAKEIWSPSALGR